MTPKRTLSMDNSSITKRTKPDCSYCSLFGLTSQSLVLLHKSGSKRTDNVKSPDNNRLEGNSLAHGQRRKLPSTRGGTSGQEAAASLFHEATPTEPDVEAGGLWHGISPVTTVADRRLQRLGWTLKHIAMHSLAQKATCYTHGEFGWHSTMRLARLWISCKGERLICYSV